MKSYQAPTSFKNGRYIPEHVLGTGTYGQVIRCQDRINGGFVAVKVARKDAAYRRSALNEIQALRALQYSDDTVNILDSFEDNGHVCIVTELLDRNLYEVLRSKNFQPLSVSQVRDVARHVLKALSDLHKAGYMHCDIKPENIMLRAETLSPSSSDNESALANSGYASQFMSMLGGASPDDNHVMLGRDNENLFTNPSVNSFPRYDNGAFGNNNNNSSIAGGAYGNNNNNIMVNNNSSSNQKVDNFNNTCLIDFGAVRQFHENNYFDIQSLWYRAPEVICGLPYTPSIDAWSVGCLLFELYTGKPVFPGENAYDQLCRIVRRVGYPSQKALTTGKNVGQFQLPCNQQPKQVLEVNLRQHIRQCRQLGMRRAAESNGGFIGDSFDNNNLQVLENGSSQTVEEERLMHLIISLLQPDEQWRLSCTDALRHPLFIGTPAPSRAPLALSGPYPASLAQQSRSATDSLGTNNSNAVPPPPLPPTLPVLPGSQGPPPPPQIVTSPAARAQQQQQQQQLQLQQQQDIGGVFTRNMPSQQVQMQPPALSLQQNHYTLPPASSSNHFVSAPQSPMLAQASVLPNGLITTAHTPLRQPQQLHAPVHQPFLRGKPLPTPLGMHMMNNAGAGSNNNSTTLNMNNSMAGSNSYAPPPMSPHMGGPPGSPMLLFHNGHGAVVAFPMHQHGMPLAQHM